MTIISADKTYALAASPASRRIVKTLENAGARVVVFPPMQTAPCLLNEQTRQILADAVNYDWLIFFDVLTVDYFLQKLEAAQTDAFELDRRRICALGEAVADRLRWAELHADVVPRTMRAEKITGALTDYIGAAKLCENRFLLVKQKSASSRVKDDLTACGAAAADELEIYEAAIAERVDAARLEALLRGGAVDKFVFAAPEDLIALRALLKTEDLSDLLRETKICAADAVTLQCLRENEFNAHYFTAK